MTTISFRSQPTSRHEKPRSLLDTQNSFGWFSIGLHWFAALAIILLWFVGQSISLQSIEQIDARRSLHITLGLIVLVTTCRAHSMAL